MTTMSIRGVSLFVNVIGHGHPLVLMHGGPGLDHTSLLRLKPLADQFTLIFYDHRCNGRSNGADVTSMTWENLTADAEALRQTLGFEKWAVLGHSFGGMVALEYALRYPSSLSHLILMDTGGEVERMQESAPQILARRGYGPDAVEACRRFFTGQLTPKEVLGNTIKFATAYYFNSSPFTFARDMVSGHDLQMRPEASVFGYGHLLAGWSVMDRLSEIKVPALVMTGREDFLFPPEHVVALASGIPNARMEIIECAGHETPSEQPGQVTRAIRDFIGATHSHSNTREPFATTESGPQGQSRRSYEVIDAYIEKEMRRLRMPGVSLAIVEGDRIAHLRGFGRAGTSGEPPTPQTPFFIGSLTKSVTALALMQLVEAGKIELDAPVRRYLRWFRLADPEASAQMTVRHLLNQTSGLPESAGEIAPTDIDDLPDATERRARALVSLELTRPVGATCEYSNMNYDLLGLIIEAASGGSYEDYIQDHVLTPLEMRHTYTSQAVARRNGLAMGHRYWFGFPVAAPNLPVPQGSLPSGLLISTAEDMAHYLIAHLNRGRYGGARVLSSSGMDELHRGAAKYGKMGVQAGKYAMGWFDDEIGQSRIVWHAGNMPDFGAYMALLPEQNKGVVLLVNACHWWFNPVLADFGMGAAALLAGEKYKPTAFSAVIPWVLRGQLLIPAVQFVDIAATLRLLRRRRLEPESRPAGGRTRWNFLLLPLIPELVIALSLRSVLGRRGPYLRLFMPDYSWTATVCGSFALAWCFLRTGLLLRALQTGSSSQPRYQRLFKG